MPKKWCPFLSTSGCFHLLCVLTQASVGILHSLKQHFLRQHFPTGRCRELFFGKLTSLLTILSATSSALTLLNASLLLPSFPHCLVPAASVATNGSFYPSPPFPTFSPRTRKGRRHQSLPQRPGRALWGAAPSCPLPVAVTGLSWPVGHLGTQAHHALPWKGPCSVPMCFRPSIVQYLSVHFNFGDFFERGWKGMRWPQNN